MFVFLTFVFAVSALVMFVVAVNRIAKGQLGMAVVFGLMAIVMSGIAGALAVYGD